MLDHAAMAQIGLEVKRAEQWVFLAIDRSGGQPPDRAMHARTHSTPADGPQAINSGRSGSMSGARLQAAKEGASEIVKTLHDGDMFCLFTFNHEVTRHIQPTEVNPVTKLAILLAIQNIKAGGGHTMIG